MRSISASNVLSANIVGMWKQGIKDRISGPKILNYAPIATRSVREISIAKFVKDSGLTLISLNLMKKILHAWVE